MRMRSSVVVARACAGGLLTDCGGDGGKSPVAPIDTISATGYRNVVLDQDFPGPIATATTLEGSFTDTGAPLAPGDDSWHIDPMAFGDPVSGKHYLYWGSSFQPIAVEERGADRVHFAAGSTPAMVIQPGGAPREALVEGPWVIKRGDALGTGNGTVLTGDAVFRGPGHNAIATGARGDDWIVYHAVDPDKPTPSGGRSVRRPMPIDRIRYDSNGWPNVEVGHPSHTTTTPPAVTP